MSSPSFEAPVCVICLMQGHLAPRCNLNALVFWRRLMDEEVEAMVLAMVQHKKPVTDLIFHNTNMTVRGARSIAWFIRKSRTITCLYLSSNWIGNDGVKIILESVPYASPSLRELSLTDNP